MGVGHSNGQFALLIASVTTFVFVDDKLTTGLLVCFVKLCGVEMRNIYSINTNSIFLLGLRIQ